MEPATSFLQIIGFKREQLLEIWDVSRDYRLLRKVFPFTATTGTLGPKLREGDLQIPEGIYSVEYLNPNSKFHLSFKLDYPNSFDREMAEKEGRTEPGSDIFIHGGTQTKGCIAIGDTAIEELYAWVEQVGKENVSVLIVPYDSRSAESMQPHTAGPAWVPELYSQLHSQLILFRKQ